MRRSTFLFTTVFLVVCSPVGPDSFPAGPDPSDAPRLASVSPGADQVRIEAGARVEFHVEATSPRERPLTITFLVDGDPRVVAPTYAFEAAAPGTYVISAVVSDGELETAHQWTVTVEPPPNVAPTVVLSIEPGSGVAPLRARVRVQGDDPDGSVVRYRLELLGPVALAIERAAPIDTVLVLVAASWQATAIVEDDRGATAVASRALEVSEPNLPPVPSLQVDPASGTAPLDALVDAGGSDPDGEIALYRLEVDGEFEIESSSPIRRTTRFERAGTFWVRLSVTDDGGAVAWDSVSVRVTEWAPEPPPPLPPPPPTNAAPTAGLTVSPADGEAPLDVEAHATGEDADGIVTEVRIDFDGDGQPDAAVGAASLDAQFRYEDAGTYTVRATTVDDDGAVATATATVTVRPPANLPPTGSLSLSVTSGDAPLEVLASADGSDPDGQIVKWEIEAHAGDGFLELDGSRTATLVYAFDEGVYRPRLLLTDDDGATVVIEGPAVAVYRPIAGANASVSGNPAFDATAIAPAVWSDGEDPWQFVVTVLDPDGEPLSDVPLRVTPTRPPPRRAGRNLARARRDARRRRPPDWRRRDRDRHADHDAQHPDRTGPGHRFPALRAPGRGRRRPRPVAGGGSPREPEREHYGLGDHKPGGDPSRERGGLPGNTDRDRGAGPLTTRRPFSRDPGRRTIRRAAVHGRIAPPGCAPARLRRLADRRRGRDPIHILPGAGRPEQARRGLGRRTADRRAGDHRPQTRFAVSLLRDPKLAVEGAAERCYIGSVRIIPVRPIPGAAVHRTVQLPARLPAR
ncbi:MAG: hypothetical protein ACREK2_06300 [Gemmatimonadota bacterium]